VIVLCRLFQVVLADGLTSPSKPRTRETAKTLLHINPLPLDSPRLKLAVRLPDCRSPWVGDSRSETTKRPLRCNRTCNYCAVRPDVSNEKDADSRRRTHHVKVSARYELSVTKSQTTVVPISDPNRATRRWPRRSSALAVIHAACPIQASACRRPAAMVRVV
jgi:hypothetical protein